MLATHLPDLMISRKQFSLWCTYSKTLALFVKGGQMWYFRDDLKEKPSLLLFLKYLHRFPGGLRGSVGDWSNSGIANSLCPLLTNETVQLPGSGGTMFLLIVRAVGSRFRQPIKNIMLFLPKAALSSSGYQKGPCTHANKNPQGVKEGEGALFLSDPKLCPVSSTCPNFTVSQIYTDKP